MDPSETLSILTNPLLTGKVTPTSNPQNDASRVKGSAGRNCHLGPGQGPGRPSPPLRTGPAARRAPRSLQIASWRPPPPRHRTVARCRAYRPAAGPAAVAKADLPALPPVKGDVNTPFTVRAVRLTIVMQITEGCGRGGGGTPRRGLGAEGLVDPVPVTGPFARKPRRISGHPGTMDAPADLGFPWTETCQSQPSKLVMRVRFDPPPRRHRW